MAKTPALDPNKIVKLQSAFELIDEVEAYMEKSLGVGEYAEPASKPPDLGEGLADRADTLTNDQLGILHAQYVAYASFIDTRLARIKAAQTLAESNFEHVKAELSVACFAQEGIAKVEVPMYIKISPTYREFEIEYIRLYMMRVLIEARYKSYSKQAEAISRIITQRSDEMNLGRQNPNTRRPGGSGGKRPLGPRKRRFE